MNFRNSCIFYDAAEIYDTCTYFKNFEKIAETKDIRILFTIQDALEVE